MNITFFTIPKGFKGHAATVQNNAIKSWALLNPRPEIMLFGRKELGADKAAKRFGCILRSVHRDPEYGIPLVNSAFNRAQKRATTKLMCFANSDMIFLADFMPGVMRVAEKFDEFLMVGQKTDVLIKESVDFSVGWQDRLREFAKQKGTLHKPYGIDYFIFTRGLYKEIPAFAIGRRAWDNWLLWHILQREIPVIDATPTILAIHQMNLKPKPSQHALIQRNRQLAGRKAGTWGRINYAPFVLTAEGIKLR